jgi:hypothetical protein
MIRIQSEAVFKFCTGIFGFILATKLTVRSLHGKLKKNTALIFVVKF